MGHEAGQIADQIGHIYTGTGMTFLAVTNQVSGNDPLHFFNGESPFIVSVWGYLQLAAIYWAGAAALWWACLYTGFWIASGFRR